MRFLLLIFMIALCSCSSQSVEDLKLEAQRVTLDLVQQLKKIQSQDDLIIAEKKLRHHFNDLAKIMISIQIEKGNDFEETALNETENLFPLSEQLKKELERIYMIEGGMQMIEKYQKHALYSLENSKLKL